MFLFYTPLKTLENLPENRKFSDIFKGYRNETLVENGLSRPYWWEWYLGKSIQK